MSSYHELEELIITADPDLDENGALLCEAESSVVRTLHLRDLPRFDNSLLDSERLLSRKIEEGLEMEPLTLEDREVSERTYGREMPYESILLGERDKKMQRILDDLQSEFRERLENASKEPLLAAKLENYKEPKISFKYIGRTLAPTRGLTSEYFNSA